MYIIIIIVMAPSPTVVHTLQTDEAASLLQVCSAWGDWFYWQIRFLLVGLLWLMGADLMGNDCEG